jgi:hypothetical protein
MHTRVVSLLQRADEARSEETVRSRTSSMNVKNLGISFLHRLSVVTELS